MIKIKITNIEEIVLNERGRVVSKIAPIFVDLETKVEQAIIRQIKEVFEEKNIQAVFSIVKED